MTYAIIVDSHHVVTAGAVRQPHVVGSTCVDSNTIFAALDDETARAILARTSEEAVSARELAEHIDVSVSTIYRQLESLRDSNLVIEETKLDPKGNHHHVYRTDIARIEVELEDGEFRTAVERREDAADRFTYLWESIRD